MRRRPQRRTNDLPLLLLVGLASVSGWWLATTASAQGVQPGAQGAVKADTGFRPNPNGFNFPNWGAGENPQGALTVDDARCLFGDAVCERFAGGRCEPTPAARMWVQEMNQGMDGGHCEGLAALSAAFHSKQRQAEAFGGKSAYDLRVSDARVLRNISTLFTTQFIEPVQSRSAKSREMSVRQIVDTLVQSMQSHQESYTLGIYGQEGGHAITPYAVEEVGSGRYLIHVYDNNYPGVGNVVEVDANADTWRYAGAALNPGEAASPWEGKGGAMDLTPLSLRFQPLQCPFCRTSTPTPMCAGPGAPSRAPSSPPGTRPAPGGSPQRGPTDVMTNANCDQLSVADRKSARRATFAHGKMVSQIPGAVVTRRRGSRGCAVHLPPGAEYDVSVAGRPGQAAQPLDTTIFRPGQVVSLDGGSLTADHAESMGIGDTSFSYRPGSDAAPTLTMATDNANGKDGYYVVSNLRLGAGHVFSMDANDKGQIVFDSDDSKLKTFDVKVTLEDEHGSQDRTFDDVAFDEHGQGILGPDEHGGLVYGMDTDSDGSINAKDPDDDNDGIPDVNDRDDDNDGVPDATDPDTQLHDADGDGVPDARDTDDDNDGTPDAADTDDDNDGIPDADEPDMHDSDNDGTPDAMDMDDDNDGTPDAADTDDDSDGIPDADEPDVDDSDHDGTPDAMDTDDDSDGIPDADEPDVQDSDDDGTPDAEEEQVDEPVDEPDEDAPPGASDPK